MSQAGILNAAGSNPGIPTSFVTDVGTAVAIANVIEILGGSGASTSAAGNIITISIIGTGFTWQVVTSANNPVNIVKSNGYICKGASAVNFILPSSATIGDSFWIKGFGNLWTLDQNASQSVTLGIVQTTVGVFGGMIATQVRDSIEVLCVTTNTGFDVIDCIGNPEII